MKANLLLTISLIILFQGCQKELTGDEWSRAYPINVHFQNGFKNDSAIIIIDHTFVEFVDSISTDPIILVGASRRFNMIMGQHTLSITIPKDNARADTTFTHIDKELWIGVNYNREEKRIIYILQNSFFPYR